jgi:hypothetical protein
MPSSCETLGVEPGCTLTDRLERERDALILVVRRLMGVLPDSEEHRTDACWGWCWNELNGDAQDEVQAVRAEARKLLAEIEAPQ